MDQFPKKPKALKLNDRVICISDKRKPMYIQRGTVRFIGPVQKPKGNFIGVEFDKLVRSEDDVKAYFKCKPQFGAFLDISELYLISNEKFDEEAFKKSLGVKTTVDKKVNILEFSEMQGGSDNEDPVEVKPHVDNHVNNHIPEPKSPLNTTQNLEKPKEQNITPQKTNEPVKNLTPVLKVEPKLQESTIKKPMDDKKPIEIKKQEETTLQKLIPLTKAEEVLKNVAIAKSRNASPIPNKAPGEAVNFLDIQKLNLTIDNLQTEKIELQIKVGKLETMLTKTEKKYEKLKNTQNIDLKEQTKKAEISVDLTSKIEEQDKLIHKLTDALDHCKDYEQFKEKFEKMLVENMSMKEELNITKKQKLDLEKSHNLLKDQLEILELEAEIEAKSDDLPSSLDEYKSRYLLIKKAFQKLDFDSYTIKDEYDQKIQQLNSQIVKIKSSYSSAMNSEEVQKVVADKNKEIKDLQDLVNDFQKSREMSEHLFEEYQLKKDELEKTTINMNKSVDLIKNMQAQIEELEGIMKESDDAIAYLDMRICERDETIKNINEENDKTKKVVEKYRQINTELQESYAKLEIQKENGGNANESVSATEYYQNYKTIIQQKQDLLKEKMNFKLRAKQRNIEAVKLLVYMDAIPKSMQDLLRMDQFDAYIDICIINDQIDIIVENLLLHFVLNDQMCIDNPSLVSMSRDLSKTILRYQYFLNILRSQFLVCTRQSEFEALVKTEFYQKISHAFLKIRDIYEYIKTNELSTQFSFSEISESALQLKQELTESMTVSLENSLKTTISVIVTALVDKFFDSSIDTKTKSSIQAVCKKLLHAQERIFDSKVTQQDLEKAKLLASIAPANIAEIRLWVDVLNKSLEEHETDVHHNKEKIKDCFWKESIFGVKTELEKHEELKNQLKDVQNASKTLEEEDEKKTKQIATLTKEKMQMDSKIVKLKIISNNFSALEMEISELRRNEKNHLQEMEDQAAKIKTIESELEEKKKLQSRDSTIRRLPTNDAPDKQAKPKLSIIRRPDGTFVGDQVIDFSVRNSLEINSLTAIITNSLNKLNEVRNQNSTNKLSKILQKADSFATIYQNHFQPDKQIFVVDQILRNIKNNQADIKREISRMNLIDLADDKKMTTSIGDFHQKQHNIAALLSKNNDWLNEFVKATKERELEYNVDIKKEVIDSTKTTLSGVYGKISILKDTKVNTEPGKAKIINLNVSSLFK